jgi:hypothetical protein
MLHFVHVEWLVLLHIQETPVYILASDGYHHCGFFLAFLSHSRQLQDWYLKNDWHLHPSQIILQ